MTGREIRVHVWEAWSPRIARLGSLPPLGIRAAKPGNPLGPGFRPRIGSLPWDMQWLIEPGARAQQVSSRQAFGTRNPTRHHRQSGRVSKRGGIGA